MSDSGVSHFNKYLKHARILAAHSDAVLAAHAAIVVASAEKAQAEGLETSGLLSLPQLETGSVDDDLALNSINYIHLQLIKALSAE